MTKLPLFMSSRAASTLMTAALTGFVWSEYRIGRQKPVAGAANRDNGSGRSVGRGLVLAYCGGMVVSIVSPKTICTRFPRAVFATGLLTAAAGQSLRLLSARELGTSFTFKIHTHPSQQVVSTGPYRLIRHPSYTGALVCAAGFCIAYGNWISPVMVAFLAGGYVRRIPSEEAAMLEGLGDAYVEYMANSKRLIPYIF